MRGIYLLDLLGFASYLSTLGIVTSLLIIIGGFTTIVMIKPEDFSLLFFMLCINLHILYLVMWTLLKMKTNNRNINGIENITTVYCYVTGCLWVKGMIGRGVAEDCLRMILFGVMSLISSSYFNLLAFGMILIATFGLMSAVMKIHGIMLKRSKWIGIYLGSRFAFLIIFLVSFIFTTISLLYHLDDSILIGSSFTSSLMLVSPSSFIASLLTKRMVNKIKNLLGPLPSANVLEC